MSDQEWLVRLQFLEEAQEHLNNIESALLGLGEQKLSREALDGILRAAHSIKGGAALMGFQELSEVAHRLEDFFKVLQGGRYEEGRELENLFLKTVDQMRQMLTLYRDRQGIETDWLEQNPNSLLQQLYEKLGDPTAEDEQATLSADAGGEMDVLLFESEIGPCLDRLEGKLQDPDIPLLRQEFLIACGEMGGLGEMLEMGAFVALCNHGLQLCTDCPDALLIELCQAILKPLRRSHGLVLVGQAGLIPEQVSLAKALKQAIEATPASSNEEVIDEEVIDADTTFSDLQNEKLAEALTQIQTADGQHQDSQDLGGAELNPAELTALTENVETDNISSEQEAQLESLFSINPEASQLVPSAEDFQAESAAIEQQAEEQPAKHESIEDPVNAAQNIGLEEIAIAEASSETSDSSEGMIELKGDKRDASQRQGTAQQLNNAEVAQLKPNDSSSPTDATADAEPDATAVETVELSQQTTLDDLFSDMVPEDFVLEEMAVEVTPDREPSAGYKQTEQLPTELEQSSQPDQAATVASIESAASDELQSTPLAPDASADKSLAATDTSINQLLDDETFNLDDLEVLPQPLSPSEVAVSQNEVESPRESFSESLESSNAIALEAAQLTAEMLDSDQPSTLQDPDQEDHSNPQKDTSIRVSVRKLERLGELLGELTTERNGLSLQLSSLSNLFELLNQRVKSLDRANNILRNSYDSGATQLLHRNERQEPNRSTAIAPSTSAPSTTNGFDLLEMDQYSELHLVSQEIIESVVQIQEVSSDIEIALGETESVSRGLNRTAQQLQVGMNQMRMRPLSAITDRFPRLLRELSITHNKPVDLKVNGGGILIERTIIEALQDPLMHLLRNCFDHGIESSDTRIAQGKSAEGKIEINASYRGNQVVITIQDDGAGINLDKIRRKILTMGLTPEEISASGEQELVNLIFEPGFSTADKVTSLSGRGVGMDVVRSNLRDIKGDISVATQEGQGSTFTITVPLSLSVTRVLIVECQGMVMALPANIVEEMLLLDEQKVTQVAQQDLIEWQGYTVPLLKLQKWLHFSRPQIKPATENIPTIDQRSALIISHGAEPYAIECDRYWGEQEVTTRTVEGNVSLPQGFSGCVVLGDGRVVPLVEMAKLMDWILHDAQRQDLAESSLSITATFSNKRTVLIIDDSINVRRFLSITLEKAGYQVEQAKDGQDAIEKLQDGITADVIMSDVEMPRLDGFGFLAQVKSLENCEDTPVVMLTSRSGDKHRQLAMSLGASGYFTKPFKQNELLQTLEQLVELSDPSSPVEPSPALLEV